MANAYTVLVIDDEPPILRFLRTSLAAVGHRVVTAEDAAAALATFATEKPDVVILDLGRDRWLSVRSTVGVSFLVTCEDRPVPVPPGIVEALIARTDEAGLALFDAGLRTGQTVRILSGPFADFVGTLERLDAAGRVRVLLTMMGTAVPVTLHRSALLPAA